MKKNNTLAMRLCTASFLGTLFGLLCFWGFTQNPNIDEAARIYTTWSFSNLMMWDIIANRTAIGFVIGLMGFITIHPLFGFRLPSFLRGFVIGSFISLTLAIGAAMGGSEPVKTFLILTITGGAIGMIIDMIVTTFIGEGSDLYETKK